MSSISVCPVFHVKNRCPLWKTIWCICWKLVFACQMPVLCSSCTTLPKTNPTLKISTLSETIPTQKVSFPPHSPSPSTTSRTTSNFLKDKVACGVYCHVWKLSWCELTWEGKLQGGNSLGVNCLVMLFYWTLSTSDLKIDHTQTHCWK